MSNLLADIALNRTHKYTKRLKLCVFLFVIFLITATVVSCTTSTAPDGDGLPASYLLPTSDGDWVPPAAHAGHIPSGMATFKIDDIGEFTFDAAISKSLIEW